MAVKYQQYKNILLTTDFSEISAKAVPHAISIAKKYRSKIYVIHVLEPILSPAEYSWAGVQVENIEDSREEFAEKNLLSWCSQNLPPDLDTRILVRKGIAINEILTAVDEYSLDLIVMATHGHTGLSHVLFGSTTERVLKRSHIPVLTIR